MVIEAPASHLEDAHRAAFAAVPVNSVSPFADSAVANRKLNLLKRLGLFTENLKGCTIERACTADDLRQAYRLVHDVFLEQGFIHPDPSRMRVRIYETTPETATFIAKANGQVVGVLSVVLDTKDLGLPSDEAFRPELDRLRQSGRRLCEVTNQAVAEPYRKSAVPTELMRCALAVLLTEGCHEMVAAVSPSHNGFYDLLGFRQVGSERSYSKRVNDPVIALSMDIDQHYGPHVWQGEAAQFIRSFFLTERNPFLSRMRGWAAEARRQFLNPTLLRQLFVIDRDFLGRLAPAELLILHRRWGAATFAAVTADVYPSALRQQLRFARRPHRSVNSRLLGRVPQRFAASMRAYCAPRFHAPVPAYQYA